jgi:hypothetical protein
MPDLAQRATIPAGASAACFRRSACWGRQRVATVANGPGAEHARAREGHSRDRHAGVTGPSEAQSCEPAKSVVSSHFLRIGHELTDTADDLENPGVIARVHARECFHAVATALPGDSG